MSLENRVELRCDLYTIFFVQSTTRRVNNNSKKHRYESKKGLTLLFNSITKPYQKLPFFSLLFYLNDDKIFHGKFTF